MIREKKKVIIIMIMIVSIVTFFFAFKNMLNKKQEPLPEVKLNKIEKEKAMAIMISEDGSKYKEYESETWPGKEYVFKKAECVDNAGNRIEGAITFDNETRKATLTSEKTIYCTLYFDYKGTGEETLPYRIQYIEDLVELQIKVNSGETYVGKYFELERDLDFNKESDYKNYQSKEYGDINGNEIEEELKTELTSGSGWKPIGDSEENSFQGIFDGKEKTISNLYINNSDTTTRVGFFGQIYNSTIKNLTVSGEVTNNISTRTGGIIGSVYSNTMSTINNCHNFVNVTFKNNSQNATGGLIGAIDGDVTITNSSNDAKIKDGYFLGGIIGSIQDNSTVTITDTVNNGIIENTLGTYTGGIVGRSVGNIIMNNVQNNNLININLTQNIGSAHGGIVGIVTGNIEASNVINNSEVKNLKKSEEYDDYTYVSLGGLFGQIFGTGYVQRGYNKGNITNGITIGGIVGCLDNDADLILDQCYNIGKLDGNLNNGRTTVSGGLIGTLNKSTVRILNSYNSNEVYSLSYAGGLIGALTNIIDYDTSIIINSYNTGKISSNLYAAGILIDNHQNSKEIVFNNVYNSGDVADAINKFGIAFIYRNIARNITNAYYLTTSGIKGTNDTDDATGLELSYFQSNDMVSTLNNNKNKITLSSISSKLADYKLCDWIQSSDGYPTIKC